MPSAVRIQNPARRLPHDGDAYSCHFAGIIYPIAIPPPVSIEDIAEEWKEVWKNEYLKTVSALYNSEGGRFIVGRRDDGTYVGVADVKDTLKVISDSIQNVLGISLPVRSETFDGTVCVVIDIPKGTALIDYDGRYYKRVGNTTRLIRGNELKDIIASERGTYWMDESSGSSADAISRDAVRTFVSMGKEIGRIPEGVDPDDVQTILRRYGLCCKDGSVSIAGMLLFSEHPRRIRRGAFLKIGEFDSEGVLRREDIVDLPLILVPEEAVRILTDRYIPPTFYYEGAFRKLDHRYPADGIRELIVNAVVHMDYRETSPVTVSVYPDHLEIFGFGGLPDGWTVETLLGRHRSVPRNQTLADVFHDAGYVENWAQGIRKVLDSCTANGNPAPEFVDDGEGLSVTIWARAPRSAVQADTFELTGNQRSILRYVSECPDASIRAIASAVGLSERTVSNNLSRLAEAGVVIREGSRKKGRWIISIPIGADDSS